ncbi:MAG: LacI family transcriptional regulator [Candidatus Marinimicrobia bacterium]|nr:LacI family transcriptional regulator [bacterium]MCG2715441.1 LacI family transcriptional regulator [Candidatus Neomarinimicrobiota bacterium]
MDKKTTLKDISKRLGLSIPTVSRALGGYEDISLKTRELVSRVAKEMNYYPNVYARSLVAKKEPSNNILIMGVPSVLQSIALNSYYAEIMRALHDESIDTDYRFVLSVGEADNNVFKDYHALIQNHAASAAIILDYLEDDNRVKELTKANVPLVVLGEYLPQTDLQCSVWTDNIAGSFEATRYLIERGRSRIVLVSGLKGQMVSKSRLFGYRKAIEEFSSPFDPDLVIDAEEMDEKGGYHAMVEFFKRGKEFDAVFCTSDLRSIGVIKALREKGFTVPDDVSVVGYDDLPIASYFDPQLTTVRQPTYQVGVYAIESLKKLLSGEKVASCQKIFKPELIIRQSA